MFQDKPYISIVIPVFNCASYIKETLGSLFNQSHPSGNYEIIVVNDGSTDNIDSCIAALQKNTICNLRYFSQENRGPAAARNLGTRKSKGNIIAFIDADCIAEENWVVEISNGYNDSSLAGVGGTIKAVAGPSIISQYCAYIAMNEKPRIDRNGITYLITGNASFSKEALLKVGGFDERYDFPGGEDPDICYRLKEAGYWFQYNKNAIVYNRHKTSLNAFFRTYFNYGKGGSFLTLQRKSKWNLVSAYGVRLLINIAKTSIKFTLMFLESLKYIVRFFGVPFKTLRYYGEGLSLRYSLIYSILDYLRPFAFDLGFIFGYIIGKFKGFRIDDRNHKFLNEHN